MKKYIPYILILIILVGFFISIAKADAANSLGNCIYPDSFGANHTIRNITNSECTAMGGIGWSSNSTSADVSSCLLGTNPKLQDLLIYATCIISGSVIPLIFALAIAMFVWGVVQYVINSDEEAKKEKGRQFMLWGIIALAVMVSVWGLVKILSNTFGIEYVVPQVSVSSRSDKSDWTD